MPLVRIERAFPDTSRLSTYQQGSTTSNTFYDARNIGNYNDGEISPDGRFMTRYPTNIASNTQGFTIPDNYGNPKNMFPGTSNGLIAGAGTNAPSSGSATDYLLYNKFFENLLYPHNRTDLQHEIQPLFSNSSKIVNGRGMHGMGTNAPAGASAVDYTENSPYEYPDTFEGSGTNAPAGASSMDYRGNNPYEYDSSPMSAPGSVNRHLPPEMTANGRGIDWVSYISKIASGAQKLPQIMETANDTIETIQNIRKMLKQEKKKKKKKGKKISGKGFHYEA